jgi:hypothetical protein
MTMDQEKQPHIYHSAEESPIPVPPVEEGWSMMKQQLDLHQPVTGRWALRWTGGWAIRLIRPALWIGAAAALVTGILVFWPGAHHHTGTAASVINTHPVDNPHPSNGNAAPPINGSDNTNAATRPTTVTGAHSTPGNTSSDHSNSDLTGFDHTNSGHASSDHTNPGQETAYNRATNQNRSTIHNPRTNHHRSRPTTGLDHTTSVDHTTSSDLTTPGNALTRHAANRPDHTSSSRRWTTSTTKLARTNQPAPKFIPAADSLLRAIHSANKTAAATKKKNRQTGLALAAGLSLSQSIPVGQQQLSSYQLLSDYIPSPYLRLYIGDRWYLQTNPHLLSAQYTPSQLIDSSGGDTSRIPGYPQYLQYNKVTLKKLYYTDIPLTINYRVFKGLYLGAGIQYSRLWQAAGEDRITLHPSNGFGSDTLFSS